MGEVSDRLLKLAGGLALGYVFVRVGFELVWRWLNNSGDKGWWK